MSPLAALRQRAANCGNDRAQIDLLRRVLASTEDPSMIRALAITASELAETVADALLGEVGDLKDRVAGKAERLGYNVAAMRRPPAQDGGRVVPAPAIKMLSSAWETDAAGVLSRRVWNAADGAEPPL